MADEYKINTVRQGFGLSNVRVFQYAPGIAVSKLINKSKLPQTNIYNNEGVIQRDVSPIERKSVLGTAIFSELRFVDRVQYTRFVNGTEFEVVLDDFTPIDTVIFTVRQSKNIIKTNIQGAEDGGTIKEYISLGDYEITIQGGIFGANGVYPAEQVANLREYLTAPVPLGIISPFLQQFEIFEVVVEDFSFPQRQGRQSEQLFEIQCSSNINPQLIL